MLKIKKTKQSIIVIINTTCNLIQTAVVCIPHIHFFHLNQRSLSKLVKIDRRVIAKLQNAKFYEMTQQMLVVGSMSAYSTHPFLFYFRCRIFFFLLFSVSSNSTKFFFFTFTHGTFGSSNTHTYRFVSVLNVERVPTKPFNSGLEINPTN